MNPVLGVVLAALLGGAGAAPCFDGDAFPPLCAEVYCAGNCTSGSGCLCSDNNTICVPDETTGCVLNSSACCPSGLFWHPAQSCCSVEPSCSPECLSDEICTDINGVSECRCNRTMYRLLDRRDLQPVVTCRGATMNISISRCLLESFGYNGSSMALRNSNESCNLWSQGIKDNKSVLTLEVLLMVGWCGNEISVNTSYVRYSNVLQVHPLLTEIVRVNPLNLSFSCSIARAVQTRLELDLQPAINSSSGLSDLGFTTTPPLDLQTHFSSSPFVPLNSASPLYVGISTAFVDMPRFSLRTEHCFSNPTGDPSLPNSLELITNGHAADQGIDTWVTENGMSAQVKFQLGMFRFVDQNKVFIFCDSRLCDTAEENCRNLGLVRNITLTPVSITTLLIGWAPPEDGASSYLVEVLGTPSLTVTVTAEYVNVTGLIPGNYYSVQVSAQAGPRQGDPVTISGYTLPNVTNNLIVSNVTIDSVSLTWLPPTGNKSSYAIDVLGEPSSNFTWVNESLTIFGLTPGNLYTFFVSAISGDESKIGKSSLVITYTVPNVTNNLIVSNITIDSVSLTWLPPTGNKSSYTIDVLGIPSSNFTWVNESLTVFGLTPGNMYTFFVSAISGDESKIGKSSLVITYTVPNVITEVDVINVSVDSVSLTWPPPNGNRSFYVVNISGDPAGVVIVDLEAVSIPHLIPGNLYTFHVSALSGDQALQGAGSSVSTYTVPSIINNLIISTFSNDSVSLRWDPPTGNKSFYIVEVSADPFSWNVTCVNESVTFDNLVLGTLYTFLVSAVAGDGISKGMSASIEYFGPTQINMLQVVTASIDAVTLEWLPPIGNKDSYLVNVSGDPARTARVYNESAFISDLVPGNLYTFCVSALSDNGSLQGSITCVSNYTVPNVTNQLSVSDVSIDSVSLSWLPPTGNRSYYSVEVSGEPASSRRVDSESVTIHKLIPGNLYTFFVSAVSGDGSLKGENRSVVSYTIPNVTNDLRVTELPGGSVSLTWLPPTGNRSFYLVEVFGDPASFVTVVDEHVNISDLIPGNLYTFSVSAVAADGLLHGNSSSVTHRVTVLISNLSVSGVSIDAVSLSWLLPSGPNFSYLVEVLGVPDSNVTAASTSVSINNLVTGNFYTFLISVILGDGSLQEKTFSISTYTVPNITNNLNISAVSIDSVSLSWLPPTGNKSYYVVEVLGVPASSQTVYDNSLTISNLIPGNLYTFLVSAVAGDGSSKGKSSSVVTCTVPNITNNLNISAVSIDSVSLSWLPPTGNKSYYVVEVLGVPASSQTVYDNSLSISNLIPGNLYTFLVSAVAGDGSSKGKSSSVVTYTVPNLTNSLSISAVSINSVSLVWLPPTGNKSSYLIEVFGEPRSNMTLSSNSASISNLIPGNLYTILVSALSGDGSLKGKSSSIMTYTVPNVIRNLTVTATTFDSVSLNWLPPTGNRSSYSVQVLGIPPTLMTVQSESVSIDKLTAGNLYTFVVSAVAGDGTMGKNSSTSAYTDNSRLYISLQLSASVGENQQKVYMLSQLQRQIEGQFPGENFTLTWTRENPT